MSIIIYTIRDAIALKFRNANSTLEYDNPRLLFTITSYLVTNPNNTRCASQSVGNGTIRIRRSMFNSIE